MIGLQALNTRAAYLLFAAVMLSSCSKQAETIPAKGEASPYLFIFAGDQDEKDPDFLAIIDVDPNSETSGEPVSSVPIGHKSSMPHLSLIHI